MNLLIIGGAGYLGSVIVRHALNKGWKVTVLDNLFYRQQSLFQFCAEPNFEFVFGDARDKSVMKDVISGADAIIHLAAIVGAKACDRDVEHTRSLNFGAVKLLQELRSPGQAVVYPCTNSGYGTKTGDVFCTEETPLDPISLYGRTKVDAEKLLLDSGEAVTLRLATVFGMSPRMRIDLLVNDFTYRAVRDGFLVLYEKHFKRNYLGIEDVARVFMHCLDNYDAMKGEPYNVGLNDANLSKEELALKIKEHVPGLYIHEADIGTDPDKRNYIISNDKIIGTGFESRQSLDDGIRQLMKGFRMFGRHPFANV